MSADIDEVAAGEPVRALVDSLYTPLDEAVAELERRWECSASMGQVDALLSQLFARRKSAVLARYIATPNYEVHRFAAVASQAGLEPIVTEIYWDTFSWKNPLKRALAELAFTSESEHSVKTTDRVLRLISGCEGRRRHRVRFQDFRLPSGRLLIDFHHHLLGASQLDVMQHRLDVFRDRGAANYYADFLCLFDRAILFESFLTDRNELSFTDGVVIPAFRQAWSRLGRRPLICRLDPEHGEGSPYWLKYPADLLPMAEEWLCRS